MEPAAAAKAAASILKTFGKLVKAVEEEEEGGEDQLCNCTFTLAYGTKVLLRNVTMKLKWGHHYGLLGPNDCGKTTLLRAIADEQVEGFPPQSECRAVYVESDIQGEQSHLTCIDYILEDPEIKAIGDRITRDLVRDTLVQVGFSLELLPSGGWTDAQTSTLSGGWRMKLALARAMLQDADVLLMDEPTNHLDVLNVAWVTKYMLSLKGKTSIIVSHDAKFLDTVCGSILEITKTMGLKLFTGSKQGAALTEFVAKNPHARSFFELQASTQEFTFPKPGHIEGVGSKGKALMSMKDCTFTYPGNPHPTVMNITVKVSLSSRVACVGQNGAGKSTMIKLLTSEIAPQTGEVYKHPGCRVAYVAQHAFHHIEEHLNKTAVEYILWRYHGGMDKENIAKPTMEVSDEEKKLQETPFEWKWKDTETGKHMSQKRVVRELTGGRNHDKKKGGYEYEVRWVGMTHSQNSYVPGSKLSKQGWGKMMRLTDDEIALAASLYANPLTQSNAEKFLDAFGLEVEFSSHTRIEALSDGQKVKVVIAGAMWNQPHIVILDEPTNYLDRDSLGALAKAIEKYDGGVVMITHNDEFCSALCPERWVLEAGRLDCQGDAEWMANALNQMVEVEQIDPTKVVKDAAGNVVKNAGVSITKTLKGKELKKRIAAIKKKMAEGEPLDSDDEEIAYENDL
jgi:elongation factor 3